MVASRSVKGGKDRILGVGISGIGWCAAEHIKAFRRNPHARVVLLHGRDEERARQKLAGYGAEVSGARFTTRYEDLADRLNSLGAKITVLHDI